MRRTFLATLLVSLLAPAAGATITDIDSVSAGTDGSPPYDLQSVTVGGYTANLSDLVVGNTDALPGGNDGGDFFGTWLPPFDTAAPSSNFNINDILARNDNPNPITVTSFGGLPLWSDVNGADPDFFIFESASGEFGDTSISVQAILSGGVLGVAVALPDSGTWGDTGLTRVGSPNGGQRITGVSFAITDLLDDGGAPLAASASLEGLQVNSSGLDPSLVAAVGIPEPATLLLVVLSAIAWLSRRRR